jgi:hypothetical protein
MNRFSEANNGKNIVLLDFSEEQLDRILSTYGRMPEKPEDEELTQKEMHVIVTISLFEFLQKEMSWPSVATDVTVTAFKRESGRFKFQLQLSTSALIPDEILEKFGQKIIYN